MLAKLECIGGDCRVSSIIDNTLDNHIYSENILEDPNGYPVENTVPEEDEERQLGDMRGLLCQSNGLEEAQHRHSHLENSRIGIIRNNSDCILWQHKAQELRICVDSISNADMCGSSVT